MTISEQTVIENIDKSSWLNQNKKIVLKSLRNYSQSTIDALSANDNYRDYIVIHNLYSDNRKQKIFNSIDELSHNSFKHFCTLLCDNDIEIVYNKVKEIKVDSQRHLFLSALWTTRTDYLIKDQQKTVDLFLHSYECAGQKDMFHLMSHIIMAYPQMLYGWISYDPSVVIRFYSDISRLVSFDDKSIDILLNSLGDNELVNQTKLKEMLKTILVKNNCSKQKRAEILFSLN